jgi:phosphopantothenoylcysteine decarboxylase/phosphopantothenate--cysteine ligase
MWENPIIQENLEKLKKLNYTILEPENGYLACGYNGKGRLCNLDNIFKETVSKLKQTSNKALLGKKLVITSGGTIEDIDPVRYISNYSSGKMGLALADVAFKNGAEVVLITTRDVKRPYKVIKVKSAFDMKISVDKEFENADCVIMAAAVADYRAKEISTQKMKKNNENEITLTLVKNPDILKELCDKNNERKIIVGFCAESENLISNAKEKILKKGCNYLIANDISRKDIGFSSDYNEVTILNKNGDVKKLERAYKTSIAKQIYEYIFNEQI